MKDATQPPRPRPVRVALLVLGAIGAGMLSVGSPWLTPWGGGFALLDSGHKLGDVPTWVVTAALVALALGGVALAMSLVGDPRIRGAIAFLRRWTGEHPRLALLIAATSVLGWVDGYELFYDPYNKKFGRFLYMLRDDIQVWLLLAGALMLACAASAVWRKPCDRLKDCGGRMAAGARKGWLIAAAAPVVLGSVMCALALEGIPHFSDSLTYLMQGRILWAGGLWIPAMKHPELFKDTLFVLVTDGRFYGKYPIGWPMILGTFDHFHLLFAANAVLSGLATLLVGFTARQFASRRVAVISAMLFGLSPWVWFHGSAMASHVASTCATLAFVAFFLQTINLSRPNPSSLSSPSSPFSLSAFSALLCGLSLGLAVLVRPGDAANFALPVIPVVLYLMFRQPVRWTVLGGLIALGALVGVGVYLLCNAHTTGHALVSPYSQEPRWKSDWSPTPWSMLARFHFQWAQLNRWYPGWGLGGVTLAVIGVIHAWRSAPADKRLGFAPDRLGGFWLLLVCSALFFGFNTAFGFTNVWWGPRWLLPAAPLLAIAGAFVVDAALEAASHLTDQKKAAASQALILLLWAGVLVGLVFRYGGQFWANRIDPPHSVSAAAQRRVEAMGLRQVVVAMPTAGVRAPLDARAGVVFMTVPFEANEAIYVRAIDGWRDKARASYPGRDLYQLIAKPNDPMGFDIQKIKAKEPSVRDAR